MNLTDIMLDERTQTQKSPEHYGSICIHLSTGEIQDIKVSCNTYSALSVCDAFYCLLFGDVAVFKYWSSHIERTP